MRYSIHKRHLVFLIAVVMAIVILAFNGTGVMAAPQSPIFSSKNLDLNSTSPIVPISSRRYQDENQQDDKNSDSAIDDLLRKAREDAQRLEEKLKVPQDTPNNNPNSNRVGSEKVLPMRPIMEINVSPIDISEKRPQDRANELPEINSIGAPRYHPPRVVFWQAPNIRYNPLYFEDVVSERYGHTYGPIVQPVVSGTRMFIQGAALPFNALVDRPYSCQSPLGFCRPGDPTPNQRQRLILRK